MKVLVIGANGYLGSKIVRALTSDGHTVICLIRKGSDISRINDIDGITVSDSIDQISGNKFDLMINAVCNYGKGNNTDLDVIEANVNYPLSVLEKNICGGCKRFVTIDTGLPKNFNMYSFSKKIFSSYGKYYSNRNNIDFYNVILEMFYGSDEPRNRFLSTIIRKMISNDIVETTVGTQKRDIISINDVIDALMMILHSDLHGYQDIPVGTGVAPTVSEIIDYLAVITKTKSKIKKGIVPMRTNEPDCIADTNQMKNIGKWDPVDWKIGLKEMYEKIIEG